MNSIGLFRRRQGWKLKRSKQPTVPGPPKIEAGGQTPRWPQPLASMLAEMPGRDGLVSALAPRAMMRALPIVGNAGGLADVAPTWRPNTPMRPQNSFQKTPRCPPLQAPAGNAARQHMLHMLHMLHM